MASQTYWDEALKLEKTGPGRYVVTISGKSALTNVNKSVHGGYVIGLAAKAMQEELKAVAPMHLLPVALNTSFCGSVFEGTPLELIVEVSKQGRRFTFLRCQLRQKGAVCLDANGCYGAPSESRDGRDDYRTGAYAKVQLPPFEQCKPYEKVMEDLGVQPRVDRPEDFRIRAVDPKPVGELVSKWIPRLESLGKTAGAKDVDREVHDFKTEAYCGFTDQRPHDVTSVIYFTDFIPPLNFSMSLRPHIPNRNHFWDWTTISYSVNFVNPVPPTPLIAIRVECEILQDTDERRCLVQNMAIDPVSGKVICVARQAALATPYPIRGAENL
ncbi:thioesterase-like superfamily-domain-containing protein [Hyaloraphidium curvatum]|nr:thioesterase-like superfamily-domain-containing protein [Hyaloraphidium curvatum]